MVACSSTSLNDNAIMQTLFYDITSKDIKGSESTIQQATNSGGNKVIDYWFLNLPL